MNITRDECKEAIREINELLKHANGQSVLNKMCQMFVDCTDCPIYLWDRELEDWCCILSDMALNEINTDMLDELKQKFVNVLENMEVQE